jgi:phosphoglycolate phosphatase
VTPQLIIFDFDGTLADSFGWFLDVADQVADRYRFKRFDRTDMEGLRGMDARQLLKLHQVPFWKVPFIVRHARDLMKQDIARITLFPGIGAALDHLSAGGTHLAVVSSNARTNVQTVLGPQLSPRFHALECGVSMFGKAARLRAVCRRLGVRPAQALFVGDEIRDATAARSAGIAFGAVAWGYSRLAALQAQVPALVFHQVDDLRRLRE